jgi:serine/threonine-protein kinase RsbW
LLDEVRIAVGEACSRAVEEHQQNCPAEPVRLALTDLSDRFEVEVTDTSGAAAMRPAGSGPQQHGAGSDAAAIQAGLGFAVIAGLADEVQISETSEGTSIRMSWPLAAAAVG